MVRVPSNDIADKDVQGIQNGVKDLKRKQFLFEKVPGKES